MVQHPLPEVNAGPDLLACSEDSLILGGSIAPGVTYAWLSNEDVLDETNPQSVFYAVNNGIFAEMQELILVGQNEHCQARDTVLVSVYPIPELSISIPETICQYDSVFFHGYGAETYLWEPASLFSMSDSSSGLFHGNVGAQEIVLNGSNEAGCEASVSQTVEVYSVPSAQFQVSANEGCAPLSVQMLADEGEEGTIHKWSLNGNELNVGAATETILDEGVHVISLLTVSAAGCASAFSHPDTIRVSDISVDYSFSPENPSITDPEVRFSDYSENAAMSLWTIDTLDVLTGSNVTFEFPDNRGGAYTIDLLSISQEGCSDSVRFTVSVKDDFLIFVPNAFTPDGDGLNDLFGPVLSRIDAVDYRFWITNRRGEVIFETRDPSKKWNGTENGSEFFGQTGIYEWHLRAKPDYNVETRHYHGLVTLIR
jgi:gliding motility-associated-like protein